LFVRGLDLDFTRAAQSMMLDPLSEDSLQSIMQDRWPPHAIKIEYQQKMDLQCAFIWWAKRFDGASKARQK
jgi:hypothetical protein